MAGIGAVISLAGSVVGAIGTIAAGNSRRDAANYEAAQLDIKANEERAASQTEALQISRQKRLALSRIQALAGAGGFTATDKTVLDLAGETERYGTFQEQLARYGGESRQEGIRAQAQGSRMSGEAAASGAMWSAAGTIIGGVASMFNKYGMPSYGAASTGRYG